MHPTTPLARNENGIFLHEVIDDLLTIESTPHYDIVPLLIHKCQLTQNYTKVYRLHSFRILI